MTRYFYTDPLAAAWMAKHFGMRLSLSAFDSDEVKLYNGEVKLLCNTLVVCSTGFVAGLADGKFYIHPDSVKLLEPQEGDVCEHPMLKNYYHIDGEENSRWANDLRMKIIQRNGIAFMWPETDSL